MRKLSRSAFSRVAAFCVAVMLLLPMASVQFATPAGAQATGGTTFVAVPVAVLDFLNRSTYPSATVGRTAADAVVLALDESQRYSPAERNQVQQEMNTEGVTLPLSDIAQARLGKALGVAGVVSGEVRQVTFANTAEGRIATVVLATKMIDVNTVEPVNGALVRVSSTPKPGYTGDDDVLVSEALSLAAYQAVQQMVNTRLPEATVLMVTGGEVQLTGGTNIGLKPGMKMMVMRQGEKVGEIRITTVRSDSSAAVVVANTKGIGTGDKAAAIYDQPAGTNLAEATAVQKEQKQVRRSNWTSKALGVLAAIGLVAIAAGGRGAGAATRDVVASALANPSTLSDIFVTLGLPPAGTLVTWKGSRDPGNVLAYEVWRSGNLHWVIFETGTHFFVDPSVNTVLGGVFTYTLEIDEETGAVTTRSLETGDEGGGTGEGSGATRTVTFSPLGYPYPGQPYTYSIVQVYRARDLEGGTVDENGNVTPTWKIRTAPMSASSQATAVSQPQLVSPETNTVVTDPAAATFAWIGSGGADEYNLQISTAGDFRPTSTQEVIVQALVPIPEPFQEPGPESQLTQTVDLTRFFPSSTDRTLFWRVGARNSADPVPPRQEPGVANALPQDNGWVFSPRRSFTARGTTTTAAPVQAAPAPTNQVKPPAGGFTRPLPPPWVKPPKK